MLLLCLINNTLNNIQITIDMTVGNFTELLGRVSNFGITEFDSISGADLQIVYGLDGIETFDLTEGFVSFSEFVTNYQNSPNYRGNLTWEELASREINFPRLGLSPETIEEDLTTIEQRAIELEVTSRDGIYFIGTEESEIIDGGVGNDYLQGNAGDDSLFGFGGRDILEGGLGNDLYFINWETGAGSKIDDQGGTIDDLFIVARNTNLQTLSDNFENESYLDLRANPDIYGDSAIALSHPKAGIIGLEKSGNDLIIDINRDGLARSPEDLTIINFFEESGVLGNGQIERINNISNSEDIVNLVANSAKETFKNENYDDLTVYRFYNSNLGIHFYTSDRIERNYVYDHLDNYTYEGASYVGIETLASENSRSVPVHRYFNRDTGTHLYTTSISERNVIEQELDNFSYEGEVFSAYQNLVEGLIPIYRFYNPITGAHFYTPSSVEQEYVENQLANFESEGIAYYALPLEADNR